MLQHVTTLSLLQSCLKEVKKERLESLAGLPDMQIPKDVSGGPKMQGTQKENSETPTRSWTLQPPKSDLPDPQPRSIQVLLTGQFYVNGPVSSNVLDVVNNRFHGHAKLKAGQVLLS